MLQVLSCQFEICDDKNFYNNADPLILQGKECIDIDDELDFNIARALLSEDDY